MFELELLDDVLSHVGQIRATTKNAHGTTTVTTITTVACFAYSGDYGRDSGLLETEKFDWLVLLDKSILGSVANNYTMANVVDSDGEVVLSSGVIERVQEYRHWEGGLQFVLVGVNRK